MSEKIPIAFTAVLLAGGRSSRMGRDKACLPVQGRLLWEHQISTLRDTQPDELLVSAAASELFAGAGLTVVKDETPGLGPLGGIAAALRAAACKTLLVLAIDLPEMSAEFLAKLLRESARTGRGVVPRGGDWFEPLAAVYPRASLELAEDHLHGEDRSMQNFIRAAIDRNLLAALPLEPDEQDFFRNVNRPHDVR